MAVIPRGRRADLNAKEKERNKTKQKLITPWPGESQLFIKFDGSNWDTKLTGECGSEEIREKIDKYEHLGEIIVLVAVEAEVVTYKLCD